MACITALSSLTSLSHLSLDLELNQVGCGHHDDLVHHSVVGAV